MAPRSGCRHLIGERVHRPSLPVRLCTPSDWQTAKVSADQDLGSRSAPRPGSGRIILLNGAPRSGKSSIARAIQVVSDVPTVSLGVDLAMAATPPGLLPGIGLRPGGERPDLEPFVEASYRALFDSMAAHARHGIDVVADLGLHDDYVRPLGLWPMAARRLSGLTVYLVGIRCPVEIVLDRRTDHPDRYEIATGDEVPAPVLRWEEAVHDPGWYDLEVDTGLHRADACALAILEQVSRAAPQALDRHRSG